jgi:hypothetical protein
VNTKMSRAAWREQAAVRVEAAQRVLIEQVEAMQSGEDWRRYLDLQARLHAYSARNAMLLCAQHAQAYAEGRAVTPEPRYFAGFWTWKALGRSVDKGQKGYVVLAPVRYDRRVAVDAQGNARPLGRIEEPRDDETVSSRRTMTGVKLEHVFELGQTSGTPVVEPPRPRLIEGEAPPGLGAAVLRLVEERGYRVDTVASAADIGGANGRTDFGARTVLIRSDMDDAQMVRTLIHEAAHALMHETPPGQYLPRPLKEVEAESVAYVVAAAHNKATGGYSFPYCSVWSGEAGTRAILATQDRVARAARVILDASPAPHDSGGRAPGAEAALAAAQERRAGLEARTSEAEHVPAVSP